MIHHIYAATRPLSSPDLRPAPFVLPRSAACGDDLLCPCGAVLAERYYYAEHANDWGGSTRDCCSPECAHAEMERLCKSKGIESAYVA